ncbi:MAG: hypothetical protein H5U02_12620 [Clostridia bacterium]|nr:hypothetical protein [Clostridia bacterium]
MASQPPLVQPAAAPSPVDSPPAISQPSWNSGDEIDLREYLLVFWRQRLLIASVLVTAVLVSAILSFWVIAPTYKSTSTIYLGYFNHSGYTLAPSGQGNQPWQQLSGSIYTSLTGAQGILTSNDLLLEAARQVDPSFTAANLPGLKARVKVEPVKDSPYLQIAVEDTDPARARALTASIIAAFQKQSQAAFQRYQKLLESQAQVLHQQLASVEKQIASAESTLKGIEASNLPVGAKDFRRSQTLETLGDLSSQRLQLTNACLDLQQQLDALQPMQIISSPQVPSAPIKPNRKLNLAVASVLGLMAGLLIALGKEYLSAPRTAPGK